MIDQAFALIPVVGPTGALVVLVVLYIVDKVLTARAMRSLKTNDLHHIQVAIEAVVGEISAMRVEQREWMGKMMELQGTIQTDQALMHQTVDYIWQSRQS